MRTLYAICITFVMVICVTNVSFAASKANITYLNGSGVLIRGTSRYVLNKGISLQSGDIMEFGEQTHAQVEFSDGAIAAFESLSRILWLPHSGIDRNTTKLFLLAGGAKVVVPKGAHALGLETQELDLVVSDAGCIVLASVNESEVFAESGTLRLGSGNNALKITQGEYCLQKKGRRPLISDTPPKSFIAELPIQFRDPLPHLLSRLGNRNTTLSKPRKFTYDEVEAWLNGPPDIRIYFAHQWRSKAKDPVFRRYLERNLKKHPEWENVLYPKKTVDLTKKGVTGTPDK